MRKEQRDGKVTHLSRVEEIDKISHNPQQLWYLASLIFYVERIFSQIRSDFLIAYLNKISMKKFSNGVIYIRTVCAPN